MLGIQTISGVEVPTGLDPLSIRMETVVTTSQPVVEFYDDDEAYVAWLNAHPTGFVVQSGGTKNLTKTGLIIHMASCDNARYGPSGSRRLTSNVKACHTDSLTLRAWGNQKTGEVPKPCANCES